MFNARINRDERGQTALETAIILIAFIVVATVFAFTILAAGSSSTERGEEAIYAGLEGVQSSMQVKGAVIAEATGTNVETVKFTLQLVSGGDPVDVTDTTGNNVIVIGYRDNNQFLNEITTWTSAFIGTDDGDTLLEPGELVEITVDVSGITTPLGPNTEFTLEVKPPTGAVLNISRSTPGAIETVMELR
ncbi:MAG: archaellin/type IV pilin N-terminal domain-containing protein [Chloroflexota bacterium]